MRITGATVVAYRAIREDWLTRLMLMGVEALRFVSHDQTTFFIDGVLKPTPWMSAARSLCGRLGVTAVCTMNDRALPKLSYAESVGRFEPDSFDRWVEAYVGYMSTGVPRLVIDYGNEPDASASLFINDEPAFRERYALAAAAAERAAALTDTPVQIGGGGWCQNWKRARDFVQWAETSGVRLDFVSLHVYGEPSRLQTAVNAVREVSDVPIWLIESGCDWRRDSPAYASPESQTAWAVEYSEMAASLGIARWHLMGAYVDLSQNWAGDHLCLLDATGRRTAIHRARG